MTNPFLQENCRKVHEHYSQLGQDVFVLNLLGKNGIYLEIGCEDPVVINNTYLLEKNGWTGLSVDIIDYSEAWKSRKNKFICKNALDLNDQDLLFYNNLIDFISIDIEGVGSRFKCLDLLINKKIDFKILCIEHDSYRNLYEAEKIPQHELLNKLGYVCVVENIGDKPEYLFEDWWINPKFIEEEKYKNLIAKNITVFDFLLKI